MDQPVDLLAVFAHPDDETFGAGGTLAWYAAQGKRVGVVCATRGEVGPISDPSLATRETLPQVREEELRQACAALGVEQVHILGYRDSGMAGTPDNQHAASLVQADPTEVVSHLVDLLRRLRPQVVITFEEGGGYGHPDHIAVHTYTTQAFEAAGDPSKYPEQRIAGLALHTPERLYYSAIPRGRVQRLMERYSHLFPPTEGGIDPNAFGVPDDRITTELDVSGVLDRRLRAIQAHQTQLTPDNPFHLLPAEVIREFLAREFFIRARPPVSGSIREHDLFP